MKMKREEINKNMTGRYKRRHKEKYDILKKRDSVCVECVYYA
jgi:hypothetical protein